MSTFEELLKTKRMKCTPIIQRLQDEGRIIDLCEIDDLYYMTFAYEVSDANIYSYGMEERDWTCISGTDSAFVYGAIACDKDNKILKMIYNAYYHDSDEEKYIPLKPQIIKTSDNIKLYELFDKDNNMSLLLIKTKSSNMFSAILKEKVKYNSYILPYHRDISEESYSGDKREHANSVEIFRDVTYHNGMHKIIHEFGYTLPKPVLWAEPNHITLFDDVMHEDDITTFDYIEKILEDGRIKENLAASIYQAQIIASKNE